MYLADIKKSWQMIREIMFKIDQLAQEWPGLCQLVHSPCKERGCSAYFQWRDWKDWMKSSGSGNSGRY